MGIAPEEECGSDKRHFTRLWSSSINALKAGFGREKGIIGPNGQVYSAKNGLLFPRKGAMVSEFVR
jgi:hypothetical protein